MAIVDLTKSHFFIRDLAAVRSELIALNSVDAQIKKLCAAIAFFLNNPKEVNSEELKSVLNTIREIAQTYNNETANLADLLSKLSEEIEYLELSKTLRPNASLISMIDNFYKLCSRK
jgi:hypothetical protein